MVKTGKKQKNAWKRMITKHTCAPATTRCSHPSPPMPSPSTIAIHLLLWAHTVCDGCLPW